MTDSTSQPKSVDTAPAARSSAGKNALVHYALALVGAAAGGAAGYWLTGWLLGQNLYGLVLPGACLGMGAGWPLRRRSIPLGILAGIAGLGLGLFTEWSYRPFRADETLSYFLRHLNELMLVTKAMIGFGTAMAYWFGQGRDRLS